MNDNRNFHKPKERRSVMLKSCSILFCAGTVILWIFHDRFGLERGDMLILTGIAILLLTCLMQGKRAEKQLKISDKELLEMREQCGKDDYNTDIYFK